MNIHEFQAKGVLKKYGVAVPAGVGEGVERGVADESLPPHAARVSDPTAMSESAIRRMAVLSSGGPFGRGRIYP